MGVLAVGVLACGEMRCLSVAMRALALLLGLIACHSTAAATHGTGPTLRMFQAISHLSTGQDTHGLTLYDELQQCWEQIDPTLAQVSDQFRTSGCKSLRLARQCLIVGLKSRQ